MSGNYVEPIVKRCLYLSLIYNHILSFFIRHATHYLIDNKPVIAWSQVNAIIIYSIPAFERRGTSRLKLWVDVEDLFYYAEQTKRLSGIQRLAFALQAALAQLAPEAVAFFRHAKTGNGFIIVHITDIEVLLSDLAGYEPKTFIKLPLEVTDFFAAYSQQNLAYPPPAQAHSLFLRLRRLTRLMLPEHLHQPAIQMYIKFADAIQTFKNFLRLVVNPPAHSANAAPRAKTANAEFTLDFSSQAAAGDWLIVLGAPWSQPGYAAQAQTECERHGLRLALLIHDIIPLRRPEWCDHATRLNFEECFHGLAPRADVIFTVSQHTADDVNRYAQASGLFLRRSAVPIPLGTGFGTSSPLQHAGHLPSSTKFVLMVSTIEARKNHMLAFRIWRALMETMPHEQIPILVFAGRTGWLVQDLMQQLDNADWLDGKIMLIESPCDADLAALYEDCLFTLFPSFYEGWGLPVTESLAHGAPCLASNRTSIPEAGGSLARYFDPDNLPEAIQAVRNIIENPAQLQSWRAQIRAEFQPVPWTAAAGAVLAHLHKITAALDHLAAQDHELFITDTISRAS